MCAHSIPPIVKKSAAFFLCVCVCMLGHLLSFVCVKCLKPVAQSTPGYCSSVDAPWLFECISHGLYDVIINHDVVCTASALGFLLRFFSCQIFIWSCYFWFQPAGFLLSVSGFSSSLSHRTTFLLRRCLFFFFFTSSSPSSRRLLMTIRALFLQAPLHNRSLLMRQIPLRISPPIYGSVTTVIAQKPNTSHPPTHIKSLFLVKMNTDGRGGPHPSSSSSPFSLLKVNPESQIEFATTSELLRLRMRLSHGTRPLHDRFQRKGILRAGCRPWE